MRIDLDLFQQRAEQVLLPHVKVLLGVGRWEGTVEVVVMPHESHGGVHSLAGAAARRLAREFEATCSFGGTDSSGWGTFCFRAA